ncbi:hypothetical protein ACFQV2_25255 [Actinokineospora soli]|uniref:Uncharacterized protein n=1 Tax=Actinokineospora soli TaxID=1048753 RepID=A0ABW2TSH0_9PSEU
MAFRVGVREESAQFADLVCADDNWLRAEFDAIVAANFGAPGGTRRGEPLLVGAAPSPAQPSRPPRLPAWSAWWCVPVGR